MTTDSAPSWNVRIPIQIGAGLAFAAAALGFAATGRLIAFALIPVGALVGLGIGALLHHSPSLRHRAAAAQDQVARALATVRHRFEDRRLAVRFALLFMANLMIFLVAWTVAYYVLPEGLLARGSTVRMMGNDEVAPSLWAEWRFMVTRNLPWVLGIPLVNLVLGYPYACLVPTTWTVFYAVILGTNSFALPMPERLGPSFQVLRRAGPYEIAAYLFVAAATYTLSHVPLPWRDAEKGARVRWREVVLGLLLSAVVIMLMAWREAAMVLALG
jgi:hypothetical protein